MRTIKNLAMPNRLTSKVIYSGAWLLILFIGHATYSVTNQLDFNGILSKITTDFIPNVSRTLINSVKADKLNYGTCTAQTLFNTISDYDYDSDYNDLMLHVTEEFKKMQPELKKRLKDLESKTNMQILKNVFMHFKNVQTNENNAIALIDNENDNSAIVIRDLFPLTEEEKKKETTAINKFIEQAIQLFDPNYKHTTSCEIVKKNLNEIWKAKMNTFFIELDNKLTEDQNSYQRLLTSKINDIQYLTAIYLLFSTVVQILVLLVYSGLSFLYGKTTESPTVQLEVEHNGKFENIPRRSGRIKNSTRMKMITSRRKTSRRKTSRRKTSGRKTSRRKTSRRKTSRRKTSKMF